MIIQKSSQPNWSKIQLIIDSLKFASNSNSFALKRYLKQKLLKFNPEMSIDNSKWSNVQAFHQPKDLFENLYLQNEDSSFKKILIHPLTPKLIVDYLSSQTEITTLDISKETLAWDTDEVIDYIKKEPDTSLVVFYSSNGLYAEIIKTLKKINEQFDCTVSTLVIIDQPLVNQEFVDLVSSNIYSFFIWNIGVSQVYKENSFITNIYQDSKTPLWYAGWEVQENILVEVLNPSIDIFNEAKRQYLETYLYILLLQYSSKYPVKGFLYNQFVKNFVLKQKIKSMDQAFAILNETFHSTLLGLVPDVYFSLASQELEQELDLTENTNKVLQIYNLLSNKIQELPEGSLEIPSLFVDRNYLEYFFFTTNLSFWQKFFKKKNFSAKPFMIYEEFNLEQYPNICFIGRYGISIDMQTKEGES